MIVFKVSRSTSLPAKPESSLSRHRLARETIAEHRAPSSILSFSARVIGMRNPIEMSFVM